MGSTTSAFVLLALLCTAGGCGGQPSQAQGNALTMTVSAAGFNPDHVKVKKDKPVELSVTRTSDETCAKAIVIDEYNVHADLPLNKPVKVAFTPTKSGELKYGCAMNKMVFGIMTVE